MKNKIQWAENEIKLVCERERTYEGENVEDIIECLNTALEAYKILNEKQHDDFEESYIAYILNRLVAGLPLANITEEDFNEESAVGEFIRCSRMESLYMVKNSNGVTSYFDTNRAECINVDSNNSFYNKKVLDVVDEMFPITMPYFPTMAKYSVYVEDFSVDPELGDFDTRGILYMITPENHKIEINKFLKQVKQEDMNVWVDIDKEEYDERKKNKIN